MKRHFNRIVLAAGAAAFAVAPARAETATRSRFLMGTVCEITAHGPHAFKAIDKAFAEIARLDQVMSLYKEDSELSRLNRVAPLEPLVVSNDLFEVLHAANEVYRFSGGAFDPTFVAGSGTHGFALVTLYPNEKAVEFKQSTLRLNLDGIGKGYALDSAGATLLANGVTSALLNFGGQILAIGAPPGGDAWGIEVGGTELMLRLVDRSVSTSSQAEQRGHIKDPRTGKPVARNGAVAVIDNDATHADAWSTALFVLGVAKAPKEFPGCAFETRAGRIVAQTRGCAPYFEKDKKPSQQTKTTQEKRP
ncbi:MAG: FAD:protein FMN transferase [Elusimicrobia bacterium]|nr:FAD:protein FMN transferase [Elusimicrobiota bacterium]